MVLAPDEIERLATWMDTNVLFYGTFDPADQTTSSGRADQGPGPRVAERLPSPLTNLGGARRDEWVLGGVGDSSRTWADRPLRPEAVEWLYGILPHLRL